MVRVSKRISVYTITPNSLEQMVLDLGKLPVTKKKGILGNHDCPDYLNC